MISNVSNLKDKTSKQQKQFTNIELVVSSGEVGRGRRKVRVRDSGVQHLCVQSTTSKYCTAQGIWPTNIDNNYKGNITLTTKTVHHCCTSDTKCQIYLNLKKKLKVLRIVQPKRQF